MSGLSDAFKKVADKGTAKLLGTAVGITSLATLFKMQAADAFVFTMSSSQSGVPVDHDAIIMGGLILMGLIGGGALAYEGIKKLRNELSCR